MSVKTTTKRLTKFAEQATASREEALFGLGKPPGKPIEVEPQQKYNMFKNALRAAGFKMIKVRENGSEVWRNKPNGNWGQSFTVSKTSFSASAFRAADKLSPQRTTKGFSSDIPGRSPQDLKKYIKWAIDKVML